MSTKEKIWTDHVTTLSFCEFPPANYEITYDFLSRLLRKSRGERIMSGEYEGSHAARWLEHTLSEQEDQAIRDSLKSLSLEKKTNAPEPAPGHSAFFTLNFTEQNEEVILANEAAGDFYVLNPIEIKTLHRLIDLIPDSRWKQD